MTLAFLIFMGAALAVAIFLFVASAHTTREDDRELAAARQREESARREAETARRARAHWEAKIAEDQASTIVEFRDPRGLGDGLGIESDPFRTGRFGRHDVPAPFTR